MQPELAHRAPARGTGELSMTRAIACAALGAALWASSGCGSERASNVAPPAATDSTLCPHAVLRPLCPKCNPALEAVYRARGNWCAEHGMPESFCPVCHPDAHGRPPSDTDVASDDGAPAEGTKVRLRSADAERRAGIETASVRGAGGSRTIEAPARIVYDATRLAQINARSAGVVREIHVDVGSHVAAGDPLASLDSAGVGADRSRLAAARARMQLSQTNLERIESLRREGLSTERDLLDARQEVASARGEIAVAQAALRVLGGGGGGGAAGAYVLRAPLSGVVTERRATIGRLVDTDEILFEVVDNASMWAEIDLPEDVYGSVSEGQVVRITVDGIEGEITGTISYLAPAIDPHTRTIRARLPLSNPDGRLRANMFGRARLETSAQTTGVLVPSDAVQLARTTSLVFVRVGAGVFDTRRVEVLARTGELVEVRGRLRPGDRVATTGSFFLKTETLRDSIGAGCCDE